MASTFLISGYPVLAVFLGLTAEFLLVPQFPAAVATDFLAVPAVAFDVAAFITKVASDVIAEICVLSYATVTLLSLAQLGILCAISSSRDISL